MNSNESIQNRLINGLFFDLPNNLIDFPLSTQIPRVSLKSLLTPYQNSNGDVCYNTRLTMQFYLFMYYIQYFDGKTPYFDIKQIANLFDCTTQSIHNILARLEQQRLISYSFYPSYRNYIQLQILNYSDNFGKYQGGYVTLSFYDYIDLFGINFSRRYKGVFNESVNRPELNEIRARLLFLYQSKKGSVKRVFFNEFKSFFPKNVRRRGLLHRIFHKLNSDTNTVSPETNNLPNYLDFITTSDTENEDRLRIKDVADTLFNTYQEYRMLHGYKSYVSETSTTFRDDCLFRLLHKLADTSEKNEIHEFYTKDIMEFSSLIITIGRKKFNELIHNLDRVFSLRSFQFNDAKFYDTFNNPVTSLRAYLKSALYINIA